MKYSWMVLVLMVLVCPVCFGEAAKKEITRDAVLADPEWQERYASFSPNPDLVETLKSKLTQDLRIDIYVGLWCGDSRNNVPPFLKIIDVTKIPIPMKYVSVGRKIAKQIKYFVDKYEVEKVPTFIFYRGETEIGRIVENPKVGIIEDSIEILSR